MAVPTIYAKLIEYYENKYEKNGQFETTKNARSDLKEACKQKVRWDMSEFLVIRSLNLRLRLMAVNARHFHFEKKIYCLLHVLQLKL